ncbi:hypothetical protein GIB67_017331 [Kingdonia uniflora]|uniref:Uncharacterized protein n=1 Tax=Kingdonia uniflora TaxID=39325 RepID=A0A7J7N5R6_9MAGN|nr:hypothetical protein GIB67_017331 [Kingdonia uniflora]
MWEVITVCDHLNKKWENEGKVRRITPEDVLQFYGVKNYKPSGGSYFCASVTQRCFFSLNSAGQSWNDNIIWVKDNCLQRDDEKPLDLRFRTIKQSVKSKVERKESLLDKVAEEETELEFVLEGLGLSRKKRVDSRSKKIPGIGSSDQPSPVTLSKIAQKYLKKWTLKALLASGTTGSGEANKGKRRRVKLSEESGEKVAEGRFTVVDDLREVEERARLVVLYGDKDTSRMVARLIKGIWLGIEEEKTELKKANIKLEKELPRSRTDTLKEVRQLKVSHAVAIGLLQVETKANLDAMVEECSRLGRHLMWKGYSEEEVDAIKTETYVEEEDEEEAEAVGIVDGLDGVSHQTVLDNQGDDAKIPEGNSEKALREMRLRIKNLESGLARERETFKALLSAQAELQDDVLKYNRVFVEQFDKMKEAYKNKEDQYVKAHFKLVEVSQAVFDLTLQVEERDAKIENVIYHAKVDAEMAEQKNEYAKLESCLEKVRAKFAIMVIPDTSRFELLKAIVAYFVKEVKRLQNEISKTLSDKGCICGAKID